MTLFGPGVIPDEKAKRAIAKMSSIKFQNQQTEPHSNRNISGMYILFLRDLDE
jgi:hypothetical protein